MNKQLRLHQAVSRLSKPILPRIQRGVITLTAFSLFLVTCNRTPRNNDDAPPPLFSQPIIVPANFDGGYSKNQLTGEPTEELVDGTGEKIISGVEFTIKGTPIDTKGLKEPVVKTSPSLESLKKYNSQPNRRILTQNFSQTQIDESLLTTIKFGEGDQNFVLTSAVGDTIPTGVPITITGKVVKALPPKVVKAKAPVIKESATTNIRYLDVDQGLPSSYAKEIYQDKAGNIWIATDGEGVSRYDGTSFTTFSKNEGLSDPYMFSIYEDKSGVFWFGTDGGGLNRFDGTSFVQFTSNDGLHSDKIRTIFGDDEGNLWLGSNGGGVSRFRPSSDGVSGIITHFTTKEGLPDNDVVSIIYDTSGNLWFGTAGGGAVRYTPNEDDQASSFMHLTTKEGLANRFVISMIQDSNGVLWMATFEGVSRYKMGKHGKGIMYSPITTQSGLTHNQVWSVFKDSHENIWIGTAEGLNLYTPSHDDSQAAITQFRTSDGLSGDLVLSFLEDSSKNIWVLTQGAGVSLIDVHSFSHITDNEGLSNNDVISIVEDEKGNLWLGTWGGGLSYYSNAEGNRNATVTHVSKNEGLPHDVVVAILEDSIGNMWFGNASEGLSLYETSKSGEAPKFTNYGVKEGLSHPLARTIIEDRNGIIWVGSYGGGLTRIEPPKNGKKASFIHYTKKNGFSSDYIYTIMEARDGALWMGTYGGGVCRFVPSDDGLSASITYLTPKEGLSDITVRSIYEESDGTLWFGTEASGLNRYEPPNNGKPGYFTYLTQDQGLTDKRVKSILQDKKGDFWVSTSAGINQISVTKNSSSNNDTYSITRFGKSDGLKGIEFATNGALIDSKNTAWWGAGTSLTKLDLNKHSVSEETPRVFLRRLEINEEQLDFQAISDNADNDIQFSKVQPFESYPLELVLPYDKNHLNFSFSALDWSAPEQILYSYRMVGIDKKWSSPNKEGNADYRNLPFGTYTFQIRAVGQSGQWGEQFDYSFVIHPPWWHTWWAYSIAAVGFILCLVLLSNWREKRLREKNIALEKTVTKRTRELHESLENLKATQNQLVQREKLASLGQLTAGIAHEIKNPLNFVNNFSEISIDLIEETLEELVQIEQNDHAQEAKEILADVKSNLSKILQHGTRANSIVTSMLQHSRTSSGKKESVNLNSLVKEFVGLSHHGMLASKNPIDVDIVFELDKNVGEVPLIAEDFSRVILNLCSNAFDALRERSAIENKESNSLYKASVTVKTKKLGKAITLEIEDNGLGIPSEIKDKILQPFFTTKKGTEGTGLGLSITNDIILAHGGSLDVHSEKGSTVFKITFS